MVLMSSQATCLRTMVGRPVTPGPRSELVTARRSRQAALRSKPIRLFIGFQIVAGLNRAAERTVRFLLFVIEFSFSQVEINRPEQSCYSLVNLLLPALPLLSGFVRLLSGFVRYSVKFYVVKPHAVKF
jgi:hypothetical protein